MAPQLRLCDIIGIPIPKVEEHCSRPLLYSTHFHSLSENLGARLIEKLVVIGNKKTRKGAHLGNFNVNIMMSFCFLEMFSLLKKQILSSSLHYWWFFKNCNSTWRGSAIQICYTDNQGCCVHILSLLQKHKHWSRMALIVRAKLLQHNCSKKRHVFRHLRFNTDFFL